MTTPQNPEAEREILATCLVYPANAAEVIARLPAGAFSDASNRRVFEAICKLEAEGTEPNVGTVGVALKDVSLVTGITSQAVANEGSLAHHVKTVRDGYAVRRAEAVYRKALTDVRETNDITQHLDRMQQALFALTQDGDSDDPPALLDVISGRLIAYEKRRTDAVFTGFMDLDVILSGLHRGDLVVLAARPSMGKTSLARAVIRNVARKNPVLFFSLEMSLDQQVDMLLAAEARVPTAVLRNRTLTERDWDAIRNAIKSIGNLPIVIDDRAPVTTADIRARARRMKARFPNLGLVAIDYLGLLTDKPERGENTDSLIGRMTRGLKLLARDLNVPVLVLAQLNRRAETERGDHRPKLADLRSSGNIEQDADVVLQIFREDYYKSDTEKRGVAEVIVAKHRNGPTGTAELAWLPEYATFRDLAKKYDPVQVTEEDYPW
ncbi:MAG: replicative DNA helicase [Bacillota bacterium]